MIRKKTARYFEFTFWLVVACVIKSAAQGLSAGAGESAPVWVVYDRNDRNSEQIAENVLKAFEYTKIPAGPVDLSGRPALGVIPETVRAVCITIQDSLRIPDDDINRLVRYVAGGGNLILTSLIWDKRMYFLEGLVKYPDGYGSTPANNWHFRTNVLAQMKGKKVVFDDIGSHLGFGREAFHEDVAVLATAVDRDDFPVLVKNTVGLGSVFVYNTSILNDRIYRGMLFSTILQCLEGIPYPVANVSSINLDDFPMPLYNTGIYPIDAEYEMTHSDWVVNVWWPDMLALADSFGVKYTAFPAFNYNRRTLPPFDFKMWEGGRSTIDGKVVQGSPWLARQIVKSEHELGFHGYNHVSLWQRDWKNMDLIVTALQSVRKRWRIDDLGPLPVSYVPPSNDIDSTGLNKLTDGMPSIKYYCSLYLGDKEFGEAREFDTDPHNKLLFDIPRITFGYVYSDALFFLQENLYIFTGIWNHFIHPDDVFHGHNENSEYHGRNEENLWWRNTPGNPESLYGSLKKWIKKNKAIHPYMQFETIADGGPIIRTWRNLSVSHKADSRTYAVQRNGPERHKGYWNIFVSNSKKEAIEERLKNLASAYHSYALWEGHLYEFVTDQASLEFPNYHFQKKPSGPELSTLQDQAVERYLAYMQEGSAAYMLQMRLEKALDLLKDNPDSGPARENAIKLALESERIDIAIGILEENVLKENAWEEADLERLTRFYVWNQQVPDGWKFLKRRLQVWETFQSVRIFRYFLKKLGNPPVPDADWLMQKELDISPDKEAALLRFAKIHNGPEHWPKVRNTFMPYLEKAGDSDSVYFYFLQRSIWYDKPEQTLSYLGDFPRTSYGQLQPLSGQIAELYAYVGQDFSRALYWAEKSDKIEQRKKLDWFLAARRYAEYLDYAAGIMSDQPDNDAVRAHIGASLFNEGFYNESLGFLYPLVQDQDLEEGIHTQITGWIQKLSVSDRLEVYDRYPALFSKQDVRNLEYEKRDTFRKNIATYGQLRKDNYDHSYLTSGIYAETGQKYHAIHRFSTERISVQSKLISEVKKVGGYQLGYLYQKGLKGGSSQIQVAINNAFYFSNSYPSLSVSFSTGVYTSVALSHSPVMTYSAIKERYNQNAVTVYHEDNWYDGSIQTSVSTKLMRYKTGIWQTESFARIHLQRYDLRSVQTRPVFEFTYQDASRHFESAVPFWTPDNRKIIGSGLYFLYPANAFRLTNTVYWKYDMDNGGYVENALQITTRLFRYLNISLNNNLSTSDVYRSNEIFFNLNYLF